METCLQDLIALKFICLEEPPDPTPYFWLDDIEGINEDTFAKIANVTRPNAVAYSEAMISTTSREVAADIESLIPRSYSLSNTISSVCSTCTPQPLYASGSRGILIKNVSGSKFSILTVEALDVAINNTGDYSFVLDDGDPDNIRTITATFAAGVTQPFKGINYKTARASVKISFTDPSVALSTILCSRAGGCGCGGGHSTQFNPLTHGFVITGLLNGIENTTQYGFIPCVTISCNYDSIICQLINYSPRSFGLAMLYRAASNFFSGKLASNRTNRVAGYDKEETDALVTKYEGLYKDILVGNPNRKGIGDIINNNLSFMRDRCVDCRSPHSVSYAHG